MSRKKKKVRGKTRTLSKVERKINQIQSACTICINDMRIINSSAHHALEQEQYTVLRGLLSDRTANPFARRNGQDDLTTAIGLIDDDLRTTKRTWYYWVGIFTEGINGEVECAVTVGNIGNSVISDLTNLMPKLVNEGFHNSGGVEFEDVKGWGWVITPSYTIDLNASTDAFIEHLVERHDIMNQEKRIEVASIQESKYESNLGILEEIKERSYG